MTKIFWILLGFCWQRAADCSKSFVHSGNLDALFKSLSESSRWHQQTEWHLAKSSWIQRFHLHCMNFLWWRAKSKVCATLYDQNFFLLLHFRACSGFFFDMSPFIIVRKLKYIRRILLQKQICPCRSYFNEKCFWFPVFWNISLKRKSSCFDKKEPN